MSSNKPNINVTPLIDILLVLLIIFMVVSPLKPTDFKAKIPQEPKQSGETNPHTLVVSLNSDTALRLNKENDLGNIEEPQKLIERLTQIFRERAENRVYAQGLELRNDLSDADKIQKTVFIKAPRTIDYGKVVKLIDAVKIAGANPISLQIDDLN
ncbi:MAG: biopolymer transporter ExbD [Acidobacteria bacterium]|nr:biopolymer transporter ExbD [Acidobacteriota bacterium]MCA1637229.1 biopolymer transporter ExbD [Acidobacteriota bacterium]